MLVVLRPGPCLFALPSDGLSGCGFYKCRDGFLGSAGGLLVMPWWPLAALVVSGGCCGPC